MNFDKLSSIQTQEGLIVWHQKCFSNRVFFKKKNDCAGVQSNVTLKMFSPYSPGSPKE